MGAKGFTIVEVMIAVTVAMLALAALITVTFTIQNNIENAGGILDISQKGRFAINHISKDIRGAKSVLSSYGSYTTSDSVIILGVPSINASGYIINPDTHVDVIIYKRDATDPEKLLRIVGAHTQSSRSSGTETIIECVNALLFKEGATMLSSVINKGDIEKLTVEITTGGTFAGIPRSNETKTSISLRNK